MPSIDQMSAVGQISSVGQVPNYTFLAEPPCSVIAGTGRHQTDFTAIMLIFHYRIMKYFLIV